MNLEQEKPKDKRKKTKHLRARSSFTGIVADQVDDRQC